MLRICFIYFFCLVFIIYADNVPVESRGVASDFSSNEIDYDLDALFSETDLIQISDYPASKSTYFDEHLSGSATFSTVFGEYKSKQLSVLSFSHYEELFDYFETHISSDLYFLKSKNLYTQITSTLEEHGYVYTDTDIEYSYEEFKYDLNDAYLKFDPTPWSSLSFGRQIVVLGQSRLFSPLDFFLPLRISKKGPAMNKASNRMPLDYTTKLSLYPYSKSEVVFLHSSSFETSELARLVGSYVNNSRVYLDDSENGLFLRDEDKKRYNFPKRVNESFNILRFLFYPRWATIGFTYMKGVHFIPMQDGKYVRVGPTQLSNLSTIWPVTETFNNGNVDDFYYKKRELPSLKPITALGAEISFPIKKTTLSFEFARVSSYRDLLFDPSGVFVYNDEYYKMNSLSSTGTTYDIYKLSKEERDLFLWAKDNGLQVSQHMHFISFGLDGNYDWGIINSFLMFVNMQNSAEHNDVLKLEERALGYSQSSTFGALFGVNIGKYLNKKKTSLLGFGLGNLAGSLGALVYYGHEFKERWRLGVSGEMLLQLSDAIDTPLQDAYQKNPMDPSVRLVLSRNF